MHDASAVLGSPADEVSLACYKLLLIVLRGASASPNLSSRPDNSTIHQKVVPIAQNLVFEPGITLHQNALGLMPSALGLSDAPLARGL